MGGMPCHPSIKVKILCGGLRQNPHLGLPKTACGGCRCWQTAASRAGCLRHLLRIQELAPIVEDPETCTNRCRSEERGARGELRGHTGRRHCGDHSRL